MKKKTWIYIALIIAIQTVLANDYLFAQQAEYNGVQKTADHHTEMNFNGVALIESYNKPVKKPIQFIGNKKARIIPPMEIDPIGKVIQNDPFGKVDEVIQNKKAGNPSPTPLISFNGLADNSTTIPPDVNGAVGPNHIMTTLNSQVSIQNKLGVTISTVTLNSFWSSLGGISGTFDPKVLYDHFSDRWIIVSSANAESNTSSSLLGVSKTNDPTGGWNLYKVDVDPTNQKWVDYPSLGFNDKWIVVQMNLFPMPNGSGSTHQIYVWNKADVYADGAGLFKLFDITNEGSSISCPSIHYDNSIGKMYTVRATSGNSSGNGRLGLRTITGTLGNEVLSAETIIQTPNPWSTTGNSFGNFAPQLGSTKTIATNDHRIQHVCVRDGKIYAVHTVFLPASGETRSAVQWWQLDSVGAIIQRGRIDDPTGVKFFAFPSVAVNKNNDVLIGYGSFSVNQYPSASYSFRSAADPINTLRDEYIFKKGEATYFKDFGSGRNRWGDYSNTVIDPSNDSVFWCLQEYSNFASNLWATYWAKVNPTNLVPDFEASKGIVCANEVVQFTNTSNFAGTNFNWTFTGGNPSSSTLANPTVTYATPGAFKVSLTLDGKTQSKEGFIIVNVKPKTTVTSNLTNPCVGKTVTLTATQLGATYLWNTGAKTRAISVTQDGDYFCQITAANAVCFSTTDTVKLRFRPLPVVTLDSLKSVNPNLAPFALTGGLPLGGTYSGPGVTNGIFNPQVAGVGIHNIVYSFADSLGCANTATKPIEVSLAIGISQKSEIYAYQITPNPSKGIVNVELNSIDLRAMDLTVVDLTGKIVYRKSIDEKKKTHKLQIDLSNLAKGVYYFQLSNGDFTKTAKVVLQ